MLYSCMFPSRPLKFLGIKFLGPTSRSHHQLSKFAQPPGSWVALHFPSLTAILLGWNLKITHLYGILRETRLTIPQKAASWLIDQGQPPGLKSSAQTKSTPVPLRTCTNIWSKPESPGAGDVDIGWFFATWKLGIWPRQGLRWLTYAWLLDVNGHHSFVIQIVAGHSWPAVNPLGHQSP